MHAAIQYRTQKLYNQYSEQKCIHAQLHKLKQTKYVIHTTILYVPLFSSVPELYGCSR